jgi:hypothetical protein
MNMTDETLDILRRAPFNLDDEAITWVTETATGLDDDARLMQLFVMGMHGPAAAWTDQIGRLRPGGVMRFFSADGEAEAALLDRLQDEASVPLLVSADLEGSRMSLAFGTTVPNPLALAAVDDPTLTAEISRIMAEEVLYASARHQRRLPLPHRGDARLWRRHQAHQDPCPCPGQGVSRRRRCSLRQALARRRVR